MPAIQATPAPPGPWSGFARRGLRNQGVCAVVALVIWLMTPYARGVFLSLRGRPERLTASRLYADLFKGM